MLTTRKRNIGLASATAVLAAALAACGASSASAPSDADTAAAQAFVKPVSSAGALTPPVNTPLSKPIPAGTRIAFVRINTPATQAMWEAIQPLGKALGITIDDIVSGSGDPESLSKAMDTVVEKGYDGVIGTNLEPQDWAPELAKLKAAGIPVVAGATMNTADGIAPFFDGPDWFTALGKELAAAAVARDGGKTSDFALYDIPELEWSPDAIQGAKDEMSKLCPSCTLRVVDVPEADMGTTAGDDIVSDLQAHPSTGYIITLTDEITIGLPQKLKLADIDVKGVGAWSLPANIQQVGDGSEDAAMPIDFTYWLWSLADQLFREMQGDHYSLPDVQDRVNNTVSLVTADNVNDYDSQSASRDAALEAAFEKLWHVQ